MKVTNLAIIVSYFYIIIFFVIVMIAKREVEVKQISELYKYKIEYAASGSMTKKFQGLDFNSMNYLSINQDEKSYLNHDEMYEKFLQLLKYNFELEIAKDLNIIDYLDKYVVIENDGMYINERNNDYVRVWKEKVPYAITNNKRVFNFTISDEFEDDEEMEKLKRLAVVNTIKRNISFSDYDGSVIFNIPFYSNNNFNTITNKSVIVTFKNCPILNNKNVDIICLCGNELKEKNAYVINSKGFYKKAKYDFNIDKENKIYKTIKEAGEEHYPEMYSDL